MKYLSFILVSLLLSVTAFSQGGWNIDYVPVRLVTSDLIGKQVKIDFRGSDNDTISGVTNAFEIRRLLSRYDTISLNIEPKRMKFIEKWQVYIDEGFFSNQNLESVDDSSILIKEISLAYIDDSQLTFEIGIYKNEDEISIFQSRQKIYIARSRIKGLLTSYDN